MKVTFIQPRLELRSHVESFWVFESPTGMPISEASIAAPNGCTKLIIPYKNTLISMAEGRTRVNPEHGVYFVGNRDSSAVVSTSPQETAFIVVEFTFHGAYPLFKVPMNETANGVFNAGTVFGKWGEETQQVLADSVSTQQRVQAVQRQLARLLREDSRPNNIVDFCLRALKASDGCMAIQDLERQTGYSRRYLNLLFEMHVGAAPKSIARILRFQRIYRKWARGLTYESLKRESEDIYYDQAHFTKEFKQMTGYSPQRFSRDIANEFGRRITLRGAL